jgi:hypothetical protein
VGHAKGRREYLHVGLTAASMPPTPSARPTKTSRPRPAGCTPYYLIGLPPTISFCELPVRRCARVADRARNAPALNGTQLSLFARCPAVEEPRVIESKLLESGAKAPNLSAIRV